MVRKRINKINVLILTSYSFLAYSSETSPPKKDSKDNKEKICAEVRDRDSHEHDHLAGVLAFLDQPSASAIEVKAKLQEELDDLKALLADVPKDDPLYSYIYADELRRVEGIKKALGDFERFFKARLEFAHKQQNELQKSIKDLDSKLQKYCSGSGSSSSSPSG